ncbi:MAG: glycosyltransferase family 2 protein [Odoribacter splanchnicus]
MNVAAITITYNDDYKFTEWLGHYQEYKDELYLHIVVDNHSCEEYASKLRTFFPCSKIIRRSSNGGCTYAYNDGIKVALADKNVDAILLIGNDIRLPAGELTKLYHFLYRDEGLGMVAPVVLKKDSEVIESVGCFISRYLFLKEPYVGSVCDALGFNSFVCETVAGGMNLARRNFMSRLVYRIICFLCIPMRLIWG